MIILASNRDDSNRDDKKYTTHVHLAFWKQIFLNVYTILLRYTILIQFLDFYLFAAYKCYRHMRNMDGRLPVLLTPYFS